MIPTVVRLECAIKMDPEAHAQRVKERLQTGRIILVDLHDRGDSTTWEDMEGTQPVLEQTTLPIPRAEDPFFTATDERDPDILCKFAAAEVVSMSNLLTMEARKFRVRRSS